MDNQSAAGQNSFSAQEWRAPRARNPFLPVVRQARRSPSRIQPRSRRAGPAGRLSNSPAQPANVSRNDPARFDLPPLRFNASSGRKARLEMDNRNNRQRQPGKHMSPVRQQILARPKISKYRRGSFDHAFRTSAAIFLSSGRTVPVPQAPHRASPTQSKHRDSAVKLLIHRRRFLVRLHRAQRQANRGLSLPQSSYTHPRRAAQIFPIPGSSESPPAPAPACSAHSHTRGSALHFSAGIPPALITRSIFTPCSAIRSRIMRV